MAQVVKFPKPDEFINKVQKELKLVERPRPKTCRELILVLSGMVGGAALLLVVSGLVTYALA